MFFNLRLNPLMAEDGEIGGFADSSSSELFSEGAETGESNDSSSESVESEPEQTPTERTFSQSELNQIVQDRLAREKQRYTPYESLISNEAKKYNMSPEQYLEAVQQQQQEAEKQRYYEAGIDPDLVSEVVAQHPAVQWAQHFMSQQQQEQMFNNQAQELLAAYPDLEAKDIPPEVFRLNNQGLPLLDAYNRILAPKMKQQAVKEYLAKKSGRVGITEGTGSSPVLQGQGTPKTFGDAKAQALAYLKSIKE